METRRLYHAYLRDARRLGRDAQTLDHGGITRSLSPSAALRLLYVVSLFPCWSETFIVREITELIAAGVDVQILSLKAPCEAFVQPDAERMMGRVRHPLSPARAAVARSRAFAGHPAVLSRTAGRIAARMARKPRDVVKSLEALGRGVEHLDWIERFDPDLIHAHWGTYPSTVAWALARVMGKPFGMTCHAHDIFANDHLLKEKIEAATVAVTISRFNVEYLSEHATPLARERLQVVHCGVDLPTIPFRPEGREAGTMVAVGRLDPIKGFDVLVDALGELRRQGRSVRCRIIGQGPLEATLRTSIARHGLDRSVELVGALPQPEVREALYRASIFALPSVVAANGDRDGIPVSLMESMAAGTPVVSTRVSGIPELVDDGREGLLVPERDPVALAGALARLLDEPGLGDRLAVAARAKVERDFDSAREARKLLKLFADGCD
jgi:colanic acid/amylovoran biosynthesis glycosyltransferase